VPSKSLHCKATDHIPTALFIDEIIQETSKLRDSDTIYAEVVDEAYINEYTQNVGPEDSLVQELTREKECMRSFKVKQLLQREREIIEKI
jgi:hypothetical protein